MGNNDVYLRAMMSLLARQTFPPDRLAEIVTPVANSKTFETFNLCDGTRTQTEIASLSKSDSGNLSRMIKRWIDEGIMIRVTDEGNSKPVHVYPIPDRIIQSSKKRETGKKDE